MAGEREKKKIVVVVVVRRGHVTVAVTPLRYRYSLVEMGRSLGVTLCRSLVDEAVAVCRRPGADAAVLCCWRLRSAAFLNVPELLVRQLMLT